MAALVITFLLLTAPFQYSRGAHTLEVHVTFPDGSPLTFPVKIEVLDPSGIPITDAYSNRAGGVAEFRERLNEGNYRLRVSGNGIESVITDFEIYPTESEHRE